MRGGRIVLFGLFGIGNLGNESTLWVTLHHLRRRLPTSEVACVCDALPDFAQSYGIRALPLQPLRVRGQRLIPTRQLRQAYRAIATLVTEPFRMLRTRRLAEGAQRLILVGTGVLDDLGQTPWELPAWVYRWCRAAQARGADVQLLAVGAGPIVNPISRFLMVRAAALANLRVYRDTYSRDYMTRLGVSAPSDEVVPDLVFAWPAAWMPSPRAAESPPKTVGIGLMAYTGWNVDETCGRLVYSTYVAQMAGFVKWLVCSGYQVRFLIGERRTDSVAVRDVLDHLEPEFLATHTDSLVVPHIDTIPDLLREIALTDFVVATRFHNLIFALALSRPVISIGYAAKFEALMHEMQLDDYCQRVETLDVERLKRQVSQLAANHTVAARIVAAKAAEYRERLERLYDVMFGPVRDAA